MTLLEIGEPCTSRCWTIRTASTSWCASPRTPLPSWWTASSTTSTCSLLYMQTTAARCRCHTAGPHRFARGGRAAARSRTRRSPCRLRAAHRLTAALPRRSRPGPWRALLQLERDGADARARAAARRPTTPSCRSSRTGSTCSVRRTWSAAPPRSSGSRGGARHLASPDQGGRARRAASDAIAQHTAEFSDVLRQQLERARRRREQHRLQQRYRCAPRLPIRSCDRTDAPTHRPTGPPAHRPARRRTFFRTVTGARRRSSRRRVRHPLGQGPPSPEHLRLRTRAGRAAASPARRVGGDGNSILEPVLPEPQPAAPSVPPQAVPPPIAAAAAADAAGGSLRAARAAIRRAQLATTLIRPARSPTMRRRSAASRCRLALRGFDRERAAHRAVQRSAR